MYPFYETIDNLHNKMDKTDIVHALNKYVEKLKTIKKTKNIG
jgi:hypothetical protein